MLLLCLRWFLVLLSASSTTVGRLDGFVPGQNRASEGSRDFVPCECDVPTAWSGLRKRREPARGSVAWKVGVDRLRCSPAQA